MTRREAERQDGKGLPARRAALAALSTVLDKSITLDEALSRIVRESDLAPRDRAFVHLLTATVLRRLGQLDDLLGGFLERPLPRRAGSTRHILRLGSAQILFLDTPPHAAVSSSVALARADRNARHFAALTNAVLRRIATEGAAFVAAQDAPRLNTPDWLWASWSDAYGEDAARAVATTHLYEPPLDITPRRPEEAQALAASLGALVLPTGSLRCPTGGRIEAMAGYEEGAWWVQDAAAALPARLFGDVAGKTVIDLCAAPGGKTAELAASGARVVAIDRSRRRLDLVRENLSRLGLQAELVPADAARWQPTQKAPFVLLDAPCTATGTIRRHPDIPHIRGPRDVVEMARVQAEILRHAASLVAPGGRLVYSVCSLEPAEGPAQIDALLSAAAAFEREPIDPAADGVPHPFITPEGDMRTLPSHWADRGGLDGFYAARLRRTSQAGG